jgi:hypothetical protein
VCFILQGVALAKVGCFSKHYYRTIYRSLQMTWHDIRKNNGARYLVAWFSYKIKRKCVTRLNVIRAINRLTHRRLWYACLCFRQVVLREVKRKQGTRRVSRVVTQVIDLGCPTTCGNCENVYSNLEWRISYALPTSCVICNVTYLIVLHVHLVLIHSVKIKLVFIFSMCSLNDLNYVNAKIIYA